jgi:signal transduction histidine kinase
MGSLTKTQMKIAGVLGAFGLLGLVGFADYVTGYELTLLVFYFLPILFALRYVGLGFAFVVAVMSALVCLFTDIAAGKRYSDFLIPVWNTSIRLSIFVLVVILLSARNHLKQVVVQRTEKLRKEIQERVRLEKELLEAGEREQRRIGNDLHDSLGQHLTAAAMAGKVLAKRLARKSLAEAETADQLVAMVEEGVELTRKLARSLHLIELRADGLEDALQELAANISKAFNISCRLEHSGAVVLTDEEAPIHLYRIAQEAVSNAIRHGHARTIIISLDATNKRIMLAVTDDGIGLPRDVRNNMGMGLRIMDYRAGMIGATFDIQNLPAGGARAVCILDRRQPVTESYAAEN